MSADDLETSSSSDGRQSAHQQCQIQTTIVRDEAGYYVCLTLQMHAAHSPGFAK